MCEISNSLVQRFKVGIFRISPIDNRKVSHLIFWNLSHVCNFEVSA